MKREFDRDKFRAWLNTRGYTQAELADRMGMTPASVSNYFTGRGNPSFGAIKRMADALAVDVSQLIKGEEGPVMKVQAVAEEAPEEAPQVGGDIVKPISPLVIESVAPKEDAPKSNTAQKKEELICSALETATELLKIVSEMLKDIRAKEATE